MNKPLFVISSPFDTYSGYGARARDLIKAIIELDKYEVKLIPQRWGETPWGFTDDHSEWAFLKQYILNASLNQQPEIWMQITVPNEFQPMGKYSIGVTAGIETTACSHEFLEGVNRMNLTLVSSEHTKKVFEDTKFEKVNSQTQQREGSIVLNKPIEVLFEGANTDIYKVLDKIETTEDSFIKTIDSIPESFAYLFVGHWMQGQIGEDRKNVGLLIKAFYEIFKNKSKAPALILKTSMVGSSTVDREELLKRIKLIRKTVKASTLPNIYLLHGEFTDEEMNQLYNHKKVKAMVNLTKGEGFGRPLLEFSLAKKPIITTNWSGHTDFLSKDFTILLPGQLTPVHPSAANTMLLKESNWFSVDQGQVGFYLKDVFENYKKYTDNANRQAYKSKTEFSWNKMKDKLDEIFTKNIPDFPKQMDLKLPKLNKIELPKLTKIENNG
jgi:glycosyltransferase involved in cell wall biosynthesis